MSTTYSDDREFEAVFGPDDVEDIRRRLERGRWWRFLNAKDRLLRLASQAWSTVSGAVTRTVQVLGLRPIVTAAKKAAGWAATRSQPIRDGVRTVGVLPTIAWFLGTACGRRLITRTARYLIEVAIRAVRKVTGWAGMGLRACGPRGERLVTRIGAWHRRTVISVLSRTARFWMPLRGLLPALPLLLEAVGAWGRQRAVSGLLRHFLPGKWARLARFATMLLLLPRSGWQHLLGMVRPTGPATPPKGPSGSRQRSKGYRFRGTTPMPPSTRPTPTPAEPSVPVMHLVTEPEKDWGMPGPNESDLGDTWDDDGMLFDDDIPGYVPPTDDVAPSEHQPGHGTSQRRVRHLGDEDRAGTFGRYPAKKQRGRRRP